MLTFFSARVPITFSGVVLGVSLVGSIGTMMGVYYTPPENTVQKHLFWMVSRAPGSLALAQAKHQSRRSAPVKV